MHRLASCPGLDPPEDVVLVEQPPADVLFLSSAGTDLSTLDQWLGEADRTTWMHSVRALSLEHLSHPAQLDHYLSTTALQARLVLVRLLIWLICQSGSSGWLSRFRGWFSCCLVLLFGCIGVEKLSRRALRVPPAETRLTVYRRLPVI